MMKIVLLLVLLLVYAINAFKPPSIEVDEHQIQEHASIGKFVEVKEHDDIVLRCNGRYNDLKFSFPDMSEHRDYDKENFENRVEETYEDVDTVLTITNVRESDTGSYSCFSEKHSSINDTIHLFVHGSSLFVRLKADLFKFNEGEVMVPCKTTKFLDKNDIELLADKTLIKSASKNYDQRYGYKITKKLYDIKPYENVKFECKYKLDPTQEGAYLISVNEPKASDNDFDLYWEKSMDWPYVGYNFTMTCRLAYKGVGEFEAYRHRLFVECPQCSREGGSHAFVDHTRLIKHQLAASLNIEDMEMADSGDYKCTWLIENEQNKQIVEKIEVAPKRAQIRVIERSPQTILLKEGHPISLSAKFEIFPNDGEKFTAKWSRMYNSSIKDGVQSETIINDDWTRISSDKKDNRVFTESLDLKRNAVMTKMSGTYILSISHLDTVQVIQWEVAIENAEPDVQIAIREASKFIVFDQQFFQPNTHLHIDCVSVSIPPAEVKFEKKTEKSVDFEEIDKNDLTKVGGTFENGYIWNVTLENDVELRCSSTRHGKIVTTTKSILVADEAPKVTLTIEKSNKATGSENNNTVYEGDHVTLTCAVPNGAADWDVFWRFESIIQESESESENHSKHVILKLNDVAHGASGNYSCVVKKGEEETLYGTQLFVEKTSRPHHTNSDANAAVTVAYDETFEIDCNMAGHPTPEYHWFKDGNPYTHGDANGSILRVTRARAEDNGQFRCLASNRAGETSNFITVEVTGAPKGSLIALIFIGIGTVLLLIICTSFIGFLIYKLRASRKIANQKDMALRELYESMLHGHAGPVPENLKGLPIDERVYYLPYNTDYEIVRENLEVLERLGSGHFGVVDKGLLQMADPKSHIEDKSRLTVAIKTSLNPYDMAQTRMLGEEMKVMGAIGKHPNVLALVGAVTKDMKNKQLLLVTEFAEFGNLRDFLSKHQESFIDELEEQPADDSYMVPNSSKKLRRYRKHNEQETEALIENRSEVLCTSDLVSFSMQIANGMEYLASIPCVHRDLAARNVLLTQNRIVRIADFGLAKRHYDKSYYRTRTSKDLPMPFRWMPLEAIESQKFTQESDVWSFGICMYEVFTLGGNPYPDQIGYEDVLSYVRSGKINKQPAYCHEEVYDLMKMCWMSNPKQRPKFSDCVHYLKNHMLKSSPALVDRIDDMLRLESEHQAKLEDWVATSRPDVADNTFVRPPKPNATKPAKERYLVVESHA